MKLLILLTSLLIGGAASADHRYDLRDAAYDLDRVANRFLRKVEHNYQYRHIQKEAQKLAHRASYFRAQVENGTSRRHLRKAVGKISRRYHDLVNEYHHEGYHNRHLSRNLNRIGHSFERVQQAMTGDYYADTDYRRDFYRQNRWFENRRQGWRLGFSVN